MYWESDKLFLFLSFCATIFIVTIDSHDNDLYLSSSSGIDNGSCGNELHPCQTWKYVAFLFDKGDTLYIKNGVYNGSMYIRVDESGTDNFTGAIIGESAKNTVIKPTTSSFQRSFFTIGYQSVALANFSFSIVSTSNRNFGNFYRNTYVTLSNIIIDGSGTHFDGYISQYNSLVTIYKTDYFQMKNMIIHDIYHTGAKFRLIAVFDAKSIVLENMTIIDSNSTRSAYGFFYFECSDEYCKISMNDIKMYSIAAGTLFYFNDNQGSQISMNNVFVDGNNKSLGEYLIYFPHLDYGPVTIKNSIFSNYLLASSAKGLYFEQSFRYITNISNVTFINLSYNRNHMNRYGLIHIGDSLLTVFIDDCVFENNKNLIGLIHCESEYQWCNVEIRNSVFKENIIENECYKGGQAYSGVYLESNAHARISIKNSTFYGNHAMIHDRTSTIIFENNTILAGYNINNTNHTCHTRDKSLYLATNGMC